jgi:hypothetical protein
MQETGILTQPPMRPAAALLEVGAEEAEMLVAGDDEFGRVRGRFYSATPRGSPLHSRG